MPIGYRRAPKRQTSHLDNDDVDMYTIHSRKDPGAKPFETDEYDLFKPQIDQMEIDNRKKDEEIHS